MSASWFLVSITWDEDNEHIFAVEAQDEEHARLIALINAPEPTATVTDRLETEDIEDEAFTMDLDRVIPLEPASDSHG